MKTNTYNFFTEGNCFHNLETHKCVLINGYHNFTTPDKECLYRKWFCLVSHTEDVCLFPSCTSSPLDVPVLAMRVLIQSNLLLSAAVSPAQLWAPQGLFAMCHGRTPALKHCNQSQGRILAKLHMKAGTFEGSLSTKYYDKLRSNTRR